MLFLSHSSRDKLVVRTLAQHLEDKGFPTWLDEWKIRVGECIATSIEKGLTDCRFVILALSPHAVSSGWVDREWKAIYWQEVEEGRVRILPILLEQCEIPLLLRTKRYVDISKDYSDGFRILVESLKDYITEDASSNFYAYAPIISKQLIVDPLIQHRNNHWDKFNNFIGSLTGNERFEVQKINCLHYLNEWGLTVSQLRQELGLLGFPTSGQNNEFTPDLAEALEEFQKTHCLRHTDGVFGQLTYRQMYELDRSKRKTNTH